MPSGRTSRTSGSTAGCTASSARARCGSSRRRAAWTSSRSTARRGRVALHAARRAVRPRARSTRGPQDDPVLRGLTEQLAGFRPPLSPDPFESLVTSITAQQVSLHAAFAIRNRLIERFGRRVGAGVRVPDREAAARGDARRSRRARLLEPQGGVRARPRPGAGRPRRARRAAGRRGQARGSSRSAGSASGRPSGSSPGISRARARGRSATSRSKGGARVLPGVPGSASAARERFDRSRTCRLTTC